MKMNTRFAVAFGIAVAACGGTVATHDDDASSDGATPTSDATADTKPSAGDGDIDVNIPDAAVSGPCNTLVNGASPIGVVGMNSTPPSPLGGMVADGVYYLTAYNDYGTNTSSYDAGYEYTMSIGSGTLQLVASSSMTTYRSTATMTTNDTTMLLAYTCFEDPDGGTLALDGGAGTLLYTATSTELKLYTQEPNNTIEQIFTHQ